MPHGAATQTGADFVQAVFAVALCVRINACNHAVGDMGAQQAAAAAVDVARGPDGLSILGGRAHSVVEAVEQPAACGQSAQSGNPLENAAPRDFSARRSFGGIFFAHIYSQGLIVKFVTNQYI